MPRIQDTYETPTFTMPTLSERAWAAGFFDGEGCFAVKARSPKDGKATQVQMVVTQCDDGEFHLKRFQKAVGGLGYIRADKPHGTNKKAPWRWYANRLNEVQMVMAALWPHLGPTKMNKITSVMSELKHHFANYPKEAKVPKGLGFKAQGIMNHRSALGTI